MSEKTIEKTTGGASVRDEFERARAQRAAFRDRHAQRLTSLLAERRDLRGVHPLADLVDDAVRWTV